LKGDGGVFQRFEMPENLKGYTGSDYDREEWLRR
jgi:hypothetical protein